MYVLILGLVLLIIAHDEMPQGVAAPENAAEVLSATVTPMLAMMLLYWYASKRTLRKLDTDRAGRALRRMDRVGTFYRFSILGLFALALYMGALELVRDTLCAITGAFARREVQRTILIDEVAILIPPLLMFFWAWFCSYPIDRRLREAALIRRFDEGLPVHPVWTRGQFLLSQFRHQMVLVLAPLFALIAWREVVEIYAPAAIGGPHGGATDPRPFITLVGAIIIFILTPIMIRHLWDTEPLPNGELRKRLQSLCKHHRVGVRQLLLWHTFGGLINAAVMGIFAPVRYILLTDALLEMMPARQVEAVMAHEIAHIKKHHMAWLLASAMTTLVIFETAWTLLFQLVEPELTLLHYSHTGPVVTAISLAGAVACWALVFGWISRRFERQADTFAVQHLSSETHSQAGHPGVPLVTAEAVGVMTQALDQVARLNHIPIRRKSWRHGSIAWRQQYLRSLIGKPVDKLWIDQLVQYINGITLVFFMALLGFAMLYPSA